MTTAATSGVTEPGPSLAVGELVVYASYGVGRISARDAVGPAGDEAVVLEFASGLVVTLPLERARTALRRVSTETELVSVQEALRGEESKDDLWSRRVRATRERVARGDPVALAEVVRDGILRERRLAIRGASASTSERDLYLRARTLLSHEISLARNIDLEVADLWIVDQVTTTLPEADSAPPEGKRSAPPRRPAAGLARTPER